MHTEIDEPKYRGVNRDMIAASLERAWGSLTEYTIGEVAENNIQKNDLMRVRRGVLKTDSDERLALLIRACGVQAFLRRYQAIFEMDALFEPNDPHQNMAGDNTAYYTYAVLHAWGAFDGNSEEIFKLTSAEEKQVQGEIENMMICRYVEYVSNTEVDFSQKTPAMLRLAHFAAALETQSKGMGTAIYKDVMGLLFAYRNNVQPKEGEGTEWTKFCYIDEYCEKNPRLAKYILMAFEEMSGLNFKRQSLFSALPIFQRYTVVPRAANLENEKLVLQKNSVLDLLAHFRRADEVISIMDRPAPGEGEKNAPAVAFTGMARVASKIADQFPQLATRDAQGRDVGPTPPEPRF